MPAQMSLNKLEESDKNFPEPRVVRSIRIGGTKPYFVCTGGLSCEAPLHLMPQDKHFQYFSSSITLARAAVSSASTLAMTLELRQ
jgi:hypothetical protein